MNASLETMTQKASLADENSKTIESLKLQGGDLDASQIIDEVMKIMGEAVVKCVPREQFECLQEETKKQSIGLNELAVFRDLTAE